MLTPEQQAASWRNCPKSFSPSRVDGDEMGATHIRFAAAQEDVMAGALHTAWKLRVEKNAKSGQKKRTPAKRSLARKTPVKKARRKK